MSVIKSLFIRCIETSFDSEYIIHAFCINNIATVSRITLLPFTKKSGIYQRAYVDIAFWHESEAAYEFIQTLHNVSLETRFTYSTNNWWVVEINKKYHMTKNIRKNTTINLHNKEDEYEELELLTIKTNYAGEKILSAVRDDPDWVELEYLIREAKEYQNYECGLCF